MQRIISILLLISLSCQCVLQLGIVAWYEANKAYVTENFCINKNKPELKCEGKCYLCKQLKKAEDGGNTGKQQPVKNDKQDPSAFITEKKITIALQFHGYLKNYQAYRQKPDCTPPLAEIFHPPGRTSC